MADTGINPVLRAAQATSGVMSSNYADIATKENSQADLANQTAQLQIDLGSQDILIQGVKQQGELASQQARLKAGAIFGADLKQQGEQITAANQVAQAAYQRKLAAAQRIEEKDSVGFMDNPLGYIVNQFTVNDDIRAHNAALQVEQIAKQHIDEINSMSSATATNQKNFEISITQASIDAGAKKIADQAQINANAAEIAGLGYNVSALKTAIEASKDETALKFQVLGAQNAQAQLKLAMDNYTLHKQEFDWKKEEKERAAEGDDFFIDRIQKGLKVMYGDKAPDLVASPKLARQYLMLLKSNSPAGKEATDAYMAGQSGVLGGSPAQVIDSIRSGVTFDFKESQQPIKRILDLAVQATSAGVTAGTVNDKNYKETLNQQVVSQLNDQLKNIKPGDPDNVFNIGSVSTLLKMPGVADTPFAQKVLAPAVATGTKFDDPKQVYATAITAVTSGKITVEQAVDGITTLYQKGVNTNLAGREITKFGLVPTENMHSYRTTIQTDPTALFGGNSIVDLTKAADVKRELLRTLTRQRIANTVFAPGGTDPTLITE